MDTQDGKQREPDDDEVEREVRRDRTFSLGEAVAREGGSGLLRGASPVSRQRQLELAVEDLLETDLSDSEGALRHVLIRMVHPLLESSMGADSDPRQRVHSLVTEILASTARLEELVRRADAEWGRIYGERPYFTPSGSSPAPEDPYTAESVRAQLTSFLARIERD